MTRSSAVAIKISRNHPEIFHTAGITAGADSRKGTSLWSHQTRCCVHLLKVQRSLGMGGWICGLMYNLEHYLRSTLNYSDLSAVGSVYAYRVMKPEFWRAFGGTSAFPGKLGHCDVRRLWDQRRKHLNALLF